eukprot:scaffold127616_cov42-Prasinocladus_malaysianus.AAC.1
MHDSHDKEQHWGSKPKWCQCKLTGPTTGRQTIKYETQSRTKNATCETACKHQLLILDTDFGSLHLIHPSFKKTRRLNFRMILACGHRAMARRSAVSRHKRHTLRSCRTRDILASSAACREAAS